jgi:hypothetical protein
MKPKAQSPKFKIPGSDSEVRSLESKLGRPAVAGVFRHHHRSADIPVRSKLRKAFGYWSAGMLEALPQARLVFRYSTTPPPRHSICG